MFSLARLGQALLAPAEIAEALVTRMGWRIPHAYLRAPPIPLARIALPPTSAMSEGAWDDIVRRYEHVACACDMMAAGEAPLMAAEEAPLMAAEEAPPLMAAEEAPVAAEEAPCRMAAGEAPSTCVNGAREARPMAAGEAMPVRNTASTGTAREALFVHMNKSIARYALRIIYDTQDFIATFCGPEFRTNGRFFYAYERKRMHATLSKAIRPWISLVGRTVDHRRIHQLGKYIERFGELAPTNAIPERSDRCYVYARCNLKNGDLYIGETNRWNERLSEHSIATFKHSEECPSGIACTNKACPEHKKYMSTPTQSASRDGVAASSASGE